MFKNVIICAVAAFGTIAANASDGYVTVGNSILKSNFGCCVHSGSWTRENMTIPGCDGVKINPVILKPVSVIGVVKFDFNSTDLNESGTVATDFIVDAAKDFKRIDRIEVMGFADSIGSAAVNQNISLFRAGTVADVLNQKLNVSLKNFIINGMGSEPEPARCSKMSRSEKIKCLEHSRRVEVKITGVK